MEWLLAISHKPLIVLWSWIVAFYHPAVVKGTFATGVGHGIFSGNANGFQGPSFFYTRHLWFHLCINYISSLILFPPLLLILHNFSAYGWMLISWSIITLIKPQKHLSRVNVYILGGFLFCFVFHKLDLFQFFQKVTIRFYMILSMEKLLWSKSISSWVK